MRTEQEIQERLAFWKGILAAYQVGLLVNHAEILINLPSEMQPVALGMLKLPPELRRHVAKTLEKSIGVVIDTLKWVLEDGT